MKNAISTRRRVVVALVVALCLTIAACGGSGDGAASTSDRKLPVVMNYLAQGAQAGFYYASELGLYRKAGLAVEIHQGVGSQVSASQVASGKFNIGFADGPTSMEAIAKGAKIAIVAPILQVNSYAFLSLESRKVASIKQLVGKTLGLQSGTVGAAVVPIVLRNNGIDPSSVRMLNVNAQTPPLPLLQNGTIDAYLGAVDLQAIKLRNQGAKLKVLPLSEVGGAFLGTSIIVNKDFYKANNKVVKDFVAASLEGWLAASKKPEAAAESILKQVPTAGAKSLIVDETRADIGLLCAPGAKRLGVAPDKTLNFTYQVMTKNKFVPDSIPLSTYFDSTAVPSDGPSCPVQ